jgi:hypothetical protein
MTEDKKVAAKLVAEERERFAEVIELGRALGTPNDIVACEDGAVPKSSCSLVGAVAECLHQMPAPAVAVLGIEHRYPRLDECGGAPPWCRPSSIVNRMPRHRAGEAAGQGARLSVPGFTRTANWRRGPRPPPRRQRHRRSASQMPHQPASHARCCACHRRRQARASRPAQLAHLLGDGPGEGSTTTEITLQYQEQYPDERSEIRERGVSGMNAKPGPQRSRGKAAERPPGRAERGCLTS